LAVAVVLEGTMAMIPFSPQLHRLLAVEVGMVALPLQVIAAKTVVLAVVLVLIQQLLVLETRLTLLHLKEIMAALDKILLLHLRLAGAAVQERLGIQMHKDMVVMELHRL
jgi:hypothetical protein